MREGLLLHDCEAVKVFAKQLSFTCRSVKLNCEGDIFWIPKSVCKVNSDGTALIEEWYYKKYIENENK